MDMLKKKNYLGIAGMIFMFLGVVLPFFKVEFLGLSESISLLKYWEGWVIILMVFYSALVIFKEFFEAKIPAIYNASATGAMGKIKSLGAKGLLIPAGIAALVVVYLCVRVRASLAGGSSFVNLNDIVKYGIGFYVEIVGIVCLVAHAFLYKGEEGASQPTQTAPTFDVNQQPMMNQQPQQPMYNQPMQQPMNNMQQPNMGMQQPMNNMQQPNMGMQQPMNNMQQSNMGMQQPMNNMQQPMDNNNQFPGNNGF